MELDLCSVLGGGGGVGSVGGLELCGLDWGVDVGVVVASVDESSDVVGGAVVELS